MKVAIMITTRDRATELYGLLNSLRDQTYQDYDLYILDDASGTPVNNFYFIQYLLQRLRLEGHRVNLSRNERSNGVCKARQQLQDLALKESDCELFCRLDDDIILEKDYLQRLVNVIEEGYTMATGITPPMVSPGMKRSVRFVSPVINRIVLDDQGGFLVNADDCGYLYNESVVLPADHFRSNLLYRKEVALVAHYKDIISKESGFREETFFSLRAIKAGYTLGCDTGAIAWHLQTPSGGERRPQFGQYALLNQQLLNRKVKQWYSEAGNFLEAYHDHLNVKDDEQSKLRTLRKNSNLIYSTED